MLSISSYVDKSFLLLHNHRPGTDKGFRSVLVKLIIGWAASAAHGHASQVMQAHSPQKTLHNIKSSFPLIQQCNLKVILATMS